jgi:hypothetical protein
MKSKTHTYTINQPQDGMEDGMEFVVNVEKKCNNTLKVGFTSPQDGKFYCLLSVENMDLVVNVEKCNNTLKVGFTSFTGVFKAIKVFKNMNKLVFKSLEFKGFEWTIHDFTNILMTTVYQNEKISYYCFDFVVNPETCTYYE